MLLLAIPIALVGLGWFWYGFVSFLMGPCGPNAPVCRSPGPIVLIFSVAVIALSVIHGLVGAGILKDQFGAILAGLFVSIAGVIVAASYAMTAFEPIGATRHETLGMVPHYDNGRIAIATGVLPYGLALILLLVSVWRSAREASRAA